MIEDAGAAGTDADGSAREDAQARGPDGDALAALEAELAAERGRAGELLALSQRLKADFDNYRRRVNQDQQRWGDAAVTAFVHQLLPVVDNLERAAAASGDAGAVRQGVEMTLRQVHDVLGQAGVAAFPSVGLAFDPERHEAVARGPAPGVPDGQVAEEYRKGYTLRGQVIRAALVRVSRNTPAAEGQPGAGTEETDAAAESSPEDSGGGGDAPGAQEGR